MQAALITGSSYGIGYELARLFAKDGINLVLTARSKEKLEEVQKEIQDQYGVKVQVIPMDLGKPEAAQELYNEIKNNELEINYLVNNAGFGLLGDFIQTSWEKESTMINLNITALTHLTKLLLPGMIKRGSGRILNVASTAAFQPGPLMSVYYATKHYVLAFSEGLAEEVKGTGITVTTLCPGPVKTNFQETAEMGNVRLFNLPIVMEAGKVAEIGYHAMKKGKRIVVPGFFNRLNIFFERFMPRSLITRMVKNVHKET